MIHTKRIRDSWIWFGVEVDHRLKLQIRVLQEVLNHDLLQTRNVILIRLNIFMKDDEEPSQTRNYEYLYIR